MQEHMMYEVDYWPVGAQPSDTSVMRCVRAKSLQDVVHSVLDFPLWGFIADLSQPVAIGQNGRILAFVEVSEGSVRYV